MKIPLSKIQDNELSRKYANDAVDTGWWSGTGDYVTRAERLLSKMLDAHAMVCNSGTSALELALRVLGVDNQQAGDVEVIVPAFTFAAPVTSVMAVGAKPVFVDLISVEQPTIDWNQVIESITPKTRAVIAVDTFGLNSMHTLTVDQYAVLQDKGIHIIHDCAESFGAEYRSFLKDGKYSTRHPQATVSIYSFHANKVLACGEGGALASSDADLVDMARKFANHGMSTEKRYWHDVAGRNFRMSNIIAGLLCGQLEVWTNVYESRFRTIIGYDDRLCDSELNKISGMVGNWLYTVAHPQREKYLGHLRSNGVDARAVWYALEDQPLFSQYMPTAYPISAKIAREAFWLPTYGDMTDEEIAYVTDLIYEVENDSNW